MHPQAKWVSQQRLVVAAAGDRGWMDGVLWGEKNLSHLKGNRGRGSWDASWQCQLVHWSQFNEIVLLLQLETARGIKRFILHSPVPIWSIHGCYWSFHLREFGGNFGSPLDGLQVVCMWDDFEEKLEAKNELLAAMDVKKKDLEKAASVIRKVLDYSHDVRQDIYNALRRQQQQQQLQENHDVADQLLWVIEDTPGASSYP